MNIKQTTALEQAGTLIKSGRFPDAYRLCQASLAGQSNPVVQALAGALAARLGLFDEAAAHLRPALKASPHDLTIRGHLVDALVQLDRTSEALALCDLQSATADKTLRLTRLRGHLLQKEGQHLGAADAYQRVVERDPNDWVSWNNLGNAMTGLKRFEESAQALAQAAKLVPDSPPVQLNYAGALIDSGKLKEAEAQLRLAAESFSTDPKPLLELYTLYRRMGREDEAYAALKEALQRAPNNADILSNFAHESSVRSQFADAEDACERAIAVDPQMPQPYVSLASLFERTNRENLLDPLHDRATRAGVGDRAISYIRALQLKRTKKFDEAWTELQFVGDTIMPARRFQLEGQLQDLRGHHEEAFAAFSEANRLWSDDATQPLLRAAQYRLMVDETTAALTAEWRRGWTPADAPFDRPPPIFLVGFPRSGTTLLDTMLMGHSRTLVLEEEPYLTETETEIGRFYALPSLDRAAVAAARRSYFERIAADHPLRDDTVVVDKHPLHLNKVATIERLFPAAKYILALRHPCDVVLSCFITSFRINNAMSNFLDLRTTAELYDQTFTHWEKARATLDVPVMDVVYERLIADPGRELGSLFEWLGLEFEASVLQHQSTAANRGHIKTASYAQVIEPIYTRSTGRWRRYQRHLEPIFPIIAPWVEKFGYSLNDDRIPAWRDGL